MFGIIFIIIPLIFLGIAKLKTAFDTGRNRDNAFKKGDEYYKDGENKSRITETNHYGGVLSEYHDLNPSYQQKLRYLNEELNFIESGDEILRDFQTGQRYTNYSRQRRIKYLKDLIRYHNQRGDDQSVIPYPPYEQATHRYRESLCQGYRYFDIKTYDLLTVRSCGYNKYFMRISDGVFVRPIDRRKYYDEWYRAIPTESEQQELNELNEEQMQMKKQYHGEELAKRLYRNDDFAKEVRIDFRMWGDTDERQTWRWN